MPVPLERSCWTALAEIGQLIGQVHGTAYGCQRWNEKALQDLYNKILDMQQSEDTVCRTAATADLTYNGDPGPLIAMEGIVEGVLNHGDFREEMVGRVAADATVGELQGFWEQVLDHVYDWYASTATTRFNGQWPGELPQAVR